MLLFAESSAIIEDVQQGGQYYHSLCVWGRLTSSRVSIFVSNPTEKPLGDVTSAYTRCNTWDSFKVFAKATKSAQVLELRPHYGYRAARFGYPTEYPTDQNHGALSFFDR